MLTLKTPLMSRAPVLAAGGNREWGMIAIAAAVLLNVLFLWINSTTISPGSQPGEIRPMVVPPALAGDFPPETTMGQAAQLAGRSTRLADSHAER
jgi:hypothetical protein